MQFLLAVFKNQYCPRYSNGAAVITSWSNNYAKKEDRREIESSGLEKEKRNLLAYLPSAFFQLNWLAANLNVFFEKEY